MQRTKLENVHLNYNNICDSCRQEKYDNGEKQDTSINCLSIEYLIESGNPICAICGCNIAPYKNCEIHGCIESEIKKVYWVEKKNWDDSIQIFIFKSSQDVNKIEDHELAELLGFDYHPEAGDSIEVSLHEIDDIDEL